MSRLQPRRLLLAAVAGALVLAGCMGGGEGPPPNQAGPLGKNARLQSSTCADWRNAPIRERYLTVDRLEEVVAGPRDEGNTLEDQRAYDVIDNRCSNHYARGFLLYEIYTRAAGFDSLSGGG